MIITTQMLNNATVEHAINRADTMQTLRMANSIWDTIVPPPMTAVEAVAVATKLFNLAKCDNVRTVLAVKSPKETRYVRSGKFNINPTWGWRRNVMRIATMVGNYMLIADSELGDGKRTSAAVYWYLRFTHEIVERGWLDGRLNDQ